ncbi:RHS repeat-associated core domain-containing protein [Elizabethkingia argenteiflava]|uniref:RHS repeat-associated core domain-containing protein n=1 Tax=Elizabethkingia argenteiflava TaxID=2681556 RepID=UPI00159C1B0B|nr:RHS repeat-associated core domain-containing protein [Elizabethkingia argenteiflava]
MVWERELDVYGSPRKGDNSFVPFLYQGQYVDVETGLAYNRFRYYDPQIGNFISQDPIGLAGGIQLYGYVHDTNGWVDVFGLSKGSRTLGNRMEPANMTHGIKEFPRREFQAHHVIPHQVWVAHQTFFDDIGLKDAKDNVKNGVFLPRNEAVANQLGFDFYHRGAHKNINKYMEKEVIDVEKRFNNTEISRTQARKEIFKIQKTERSRLSKRSRLGNAIR